MNSLFDEIFKLKQIERKGWRVRNVSARPESDAEHTFSMTMLALEFMSKCSHSLDEAKVLKMIAYHELGEIDVGDILYIDTEHRKDKHEKELACVKRISEECEMPEILELWQEFEEDKTPEAHFVKLIDRYDGILQAKKYDETCNRNDLYCEFSTSSKAFLEEIEGILKNKKI